MQTWPDGSVRMAQVQFTELCQGATLQTYEVGQNLTPLTGSFVENEWVAAFGQDMAFGARVQDPLGVSYEAFASGDGETLQETFLVRVRRYRLYHPSVTLVSA